MGDGDREPKMKLNMQHGFMKSIVKNQLDRDQYDKEVKQKEAAQKSMLKRAAKSPIVSNANSRKEKKPEIAIYVPPHRKNNNNNDDEPSSPSQVPASAESTESQPNVILFKLEFEDDFGKIHNICVRKGDDPECLASKLGDETGVASSTVKALAQRLASEIRRRENSKQ